MQQQWTSARALVAAVAVALVAAGAPGRQGQGSGLVVEVAIVPGHGSISPARSGTACAKSPAPLPPPPTPRCAAAVPAAAVSATPPPTLRVALLSPAAAPANKYAWSVVASANPPGLTVRGDGRSVGTVEYAVFFNRSGPARGWLLSGAVELTNPPGAPAAALSEVQVEAQLQAPGAAPLSKPADCASDASGGLALLPGGRVVCPFALELPRGTPTRAVTVTAQAALARGGGVVSSAPTALALVASAAPTDLGACAVLTDGFAPDGAQPNGFYGDKRPSPGLGVPVCQPLVARYVAAFGPFSGAAACGNFRVAQVARANPLGGEQLTAVGSSLTLLVVDDCNSGKAGGGADAITSPLPIPIPLPVPSPHPPPASPPSPPSPPPPPPPAAATPAAPPAAASPPPAASSGKEYEYQYEYEYEVPAGGAAGGDITYDDTKAAGRRRRRLLQAREWALAAVAEGLMEPGGAWPPPQPPLGSWAVTLGAAAEGEAPGATEEGWEAEDRQAALLPEAAPYGLSALGAVEAAGGPTVYALDPTAVDSGANVQQLLIQQQQRRQQQRRQQQRQQQQRQRQQWAEDDDETAAVAKEEELEVTTDVAEEEETAAAAGIEPLSLMRRLLTMTVAAVADKRSPAAPNSAEVAAAAAAGPKVTTVAIAGLSVIKPVAYDWVVKTTPKQAMVNVKRGASANITYTVRVSRAQRAAGAVLSGSVRISNPGAVPLPLVKVSVEIPRPVGPAASWARAACPVDAAGRLLPVPARSSTVCRFSLAYASALAKSSLVARAAVAANGGAEFSSAAVPFDTASAARRVLGPCALVSDTFARPDAAAPRLLAPSALAAGAKVPELPGSRVKCSEGVYEYTVRVTPLGAATACGLYQVSVHPGCLGDWPEGPSCFTHFMDG
jgi:hypothetical protein